MNILRLHPVLRCACNSSQCNAYLLLQTKRLQEHKGSTETKLTETDRPASRRQQMSCLRLLSVLLSNHGRLIALAQILVKLSGYLERHTCTLRRC
jgi:hypothetical protein